MKSLLLLTAATSFVAAATPPSVIPEPSEDRWMYPANATPGTRSQAATFSALPDDGNQEDRWGFMLLAFDTSVVAPVGLPPSAYRIRSISLRATTGQGDTFDYDPTYDPVSSYGTPSRPATKIDTDPGRPVELHGAGFRNGFTSSNFAESSPYGFPSRNAYPLGFDETAQARDVSDNVTEGFESKPWAIGQTTDAPPGTSVGLESEFNFEINVNLPGVDQYLRESLAVGKLWLSLSSLHPAIQQGGELASWVTRDDAVHIFFGDLAPQLTIDVEVQLPLSIDAAAGGPILNWPQSAGYTFQLQASPDLTMPSWQTIHSDAATDSSPGTFQDTTSDSRRFYRIQFFPTP